MVLVEVKLGTESMFFVQVSSNELVSQLRDTIVETHNKRITLLRLCDTMKELTTYESISFEEEKQNITDRLVYRNDQLVAESNDAEYKVPTIVPTRDQNVVQPYVHGDPPMTFSLMSIPDKTREWINGLHEGKAPLILSKCNAIIENMKQAFLDEYPDSGSLPEEGGDNEKFCSKEINIWWAGKNLNQLGNEKMLSDFVGKNEKTRIIVKMSTKEAGAPMRESSIDETAYRSILSYYHEKRRTDKLLEEDDDDSYLTSQWSDPRALKKKLYGVKDISSLI